MGGGPVNELLAFFGWHTPSWVDDPQFSLASIVLLGVWQFGAPMVIFLAGLKQVPAELYEAASVDARLGDAPAAPPKGDGTIYKLMQRKHEEVVFGKKTIDQALEEFWRDAEEALK
jgi:hypothetical protein